MFIVSLAFLTVFIFTCATTHIVLRKFNELVNTRIHLLNDGIFVSVAKDRNDVTLDAIKEAPFSLIIAIICFLSVWSVIGLAGFHTYLTTSDQTTNEDVSSPRTINENDFSMILLLFRSKARSLRREASLPLIRILEETSVQTAFTFCVDL